MIELGELDRPRSTKLHLAARLRATREEVFGELGSVEVARRLGVPERTWTNYEDGVTIPGEVLLRYMTITGLEPGWLLIGSGPKYRPADHGG